MNHSTKTIFCLVVVFLLIALPPISASADTRLTIFFTGNTLGNTMPVRL